MGNEWRDIFTHTQKTHFPCPSECEPLTYALGKDFLKHANFFTKSPCIKLDDQNGLSANPNTTHRSIVGSSIYVNNTRVDLIDSDAHAKKDALTHVPALFKSVKVGSEEAMLMTAMKLS